MDDGGGMCLGGGEKSVNNAEDDKRDDEGSKSDESMKGQDEQTQWDQYQWIPGHAYMDQGWGWKYSGPSYFGQGFCGIVEGDDEPNERPTK